MHSRSGSFKEHQRQESGPSAKDFQVKNIPGSTQRRIFWEVVQEEVGPDPTPRMPWSCDRPKVPRKAKRMENAKDKKKKRIWEKETSKTSMHTIKSQQKKKERENTVAQRKALDKCSS